jgi:hypothetical protein
MKAVKKLKQSDWENQKYESEFRDVKFPGKNPEQEFDKWLEENAKFKIYFEDKGQDFLRWWLDKGGEVLHSDLQSFVWGGKIVDLRSLAVGFQPELKDGNKIGILNYKVIKIEKFNQPQPPKI